MEIKSKQHLYLAFSFQIALMLLLTFISFNSIKEIKYDLDQIINNNNLKIEFTSNMLHSARERSILLHRLVLTKDPFERDEQTINLDHYGSLFADNRIKLMSMDLSEEELNILRAQGHITSTRAVPSQNKVLELAIEDLLTKAKNILLHEAMPAQDEVLLELNKLIDFQKKSAHQASLKAKKTYQETKFILIVIAITVFILASITAKIYTKKIDIAETKLFEEKERAQITLSSIGDAIISTDAHGIIEMVNPSAESLLIFNQEQMIGKTIDSIVEIENQSEQTRPTNPISESLASRKTVSATHKMAHRKSDGSTFSIDYTVAPITYANNIILGAILVFRDVSLIHDMTKQLNYEASHDPLTGLLNRREFEKLLNHAIETSKSTHLAHALCFIDLDKFKTVNDTCGHEAGDKLLIDITRIFQKHTRQSDSLARLGGDEFAVLLEACSIAKAVEYGNQLIESVNALAFNCKGQTFYVGMSVGITEISQHSQNLKNTLAAADSACYLAKQNGRNQIQLNVPS
ncbi:MAG: diguanylate cyclase [Gammaproteobacteria bacterium]|nr:diguanylate cyclase [Gammaproteobacteria bacterium]